MKTLIIKLKTSLLLASLLIPVTTYARLVGVVHEVQGSAFVINGKQTNTLVKGQELIEGSEVLVSENTQVSIKDYYDRFYYLAPGSHLVLGDQRVGLKKGSVWIKSLSSKNIVAVETANSYINQISGDAVISFNELLQRTQALVVKGEIDIANKQDRSLKYSVDAGMFTFVDPQYDRGYPRTPTMVGGDSIKETLSLFKQVKEEKVISPAPKRSIASVSSTSGKIIFVKTKVPTRDLASVESVDYFKQKLNEPKKVHKPKPLPKTKVRIFGYAKKSALKSSSKKVLTQRSPSSFVSKKPKLLESPRESTFEMSLKKHLKNSPVHDPEVQQLIDDLKSY